MPAADLHIPGYELLERLGAGSLGVVYRARQVSLDRVVAIKVLHPRYSSDRRFVERLYAEGRKAARLNHPHIVQAIDVVESEGSCCLVMEYVQGLTLAERLRQGGRLDEPEAVRLAAEVAQALQHAHARGLVHCDVKPQNIMLTPAGRAKLADLGLARQAADSQTAGGPFGTPHYVAPEQVRGAAIDARTDVYGLGCTLYHMVTGRVPFTAATPAEVMRQHVEDQPPAPEHLNPRISLGLACVLGVMLAKSPAQRYASMDPLLQDLQALAEGHSPLQAQPKVRLDQLLEVEQAGRPVPRRAERLPLLFWLFLASAALNVLLMLALILVLRR